MKIQWKPLVLPPRIAHGMTLSLGVEVRNAGDELWPAAESTPAYRRGQFSVRISHRWCGAHGIDCPGFLSRFNLTASLPPEQWQTIPAVITAPPSAGDYELQFDAVQEMVGWFGNTGARRLLVPVHVE
ncbi:MAG: hypothetical protein DMF56_18910 [Acidobacteria bacterium]|nr:MAG: hypothetical protein DMF56_18910 [Acidobacteriota bacterium]